MDYVLQQMKLEKIDDSEFPFADEEEINAKAKMLGER